MFKVLGRLKKKLLARVHVDALSRDFNLTSRELIKLNLVQKLDKTRSSVVLNIKFEVILYQLYKTELFPGVNLAPKCHFRNELCVGRVIKVASHSPHRKLLLGGCC